uniref:Uncharacterized protein n=1 Tax=Anguilla anguilla TaxID=7936 RepID=A0A0E9VGG3_ANGAN
MRHTTHRPGNYALNHL